jgi:hypothetical protein
LDSGADDPFYTSPRCAQYTCHNTPPSDQRRRRKTSYLAPCQSDNALIYLQLNVMVSFLDAGGVTLAIISSCHVSPIEWCDERDFDRTIDICSYVKQNKNRMFRVRVLRLSMPSRVSVSKQDYLLYTSPFSELVQATEGAPMGRRSSERSSRSKKPGPRR